MDLQHCNVREFFEKTVRSHPDDPFLIWALDGRTVSYAEADDLANRAADVWHRRGVRRGDRVAFMLDNCPEFLFAWLGLAKLGAVLVAVNTRFGVREATYVVSNSQAAISLVGAEHRPVFEQVRARAPGLQHILTVDEDAPDSFADQLAAARPDRPDVELTGDDLISLIYTSGTTGYPKGVMQTHRNFVLTGQAYGPWMRMLTAQRIYACLPLFHINSQAYSTMGAIGVGGAMVLAPKFSASQFWPQVRAYHANVFNFIGAMTVILSKSAPSALDRDHDVHTAYGVPALAPELRVALEDRFGLTIVSGFGMSETTFGLLEPLDQPRRPGCMGLPRHHPDPSVPRTEVKIVDDGGAEVAPGVTGELVLRNAAMMVGYFADEERTAQALRGGWLHTGDSAYRDADGYYFFVDRKRDIVRRRGENISSLEVERVIEGHPAVLEAAVIGVPSELTDEELLAFVVPRPGQQPDPGEVFAWCSSRLASFKVPRFLEFVENLPKTSTSKIQKSVLRERAAATAPASRVDRERRSRDLTPLVTRVTMQAPLSSNIAKRSEPPKSPRCSTVGKVVRLLEALAASEDPIGVREVARYTGIDKSAVSRILDRLTQIEVAERAPTSARYGPGPRLFALGATLHGRDTLWQDAEPILRELVGRFNETCYLATREADQVVFREKVDCDHHVRYVIDPGERVSLHAGAGGRAVLAGLPVEEVDDVIARLELARLTERTVTDPGELRRQAAGDRRRGYSVSMGERVVDGSAVAAPYFQASGQCRGAIVFTCPAARFDLRRVPEISDAVLEAAHRLSARLGYHGAAPETSPA